MIVQQINQKSFLSKIDSRIKVSLILCSLLLVNFFSFKENFLLLLLVIVLFLSGKMVSLRLLKSVFWIIIFIIFLMLMTTASWIFENSGQDIPEYLRAFFPLYLKIALSYSFLCLLIFSTPFLEILHALNFFRFPAVLITLFYLQFTFLHILWREIVSRLNAFHLKLLFQKARLAELAYFFSALLVFLHHKAQNLYHGMCSRNFKLSLYPKYSRQLTSADIFFALFYVMIIFLIKWIV